MSRDLTATTYDALDNVVVEPFFAVELLFDDTPIRMWTGLGEKFIDGVNYVGVGSILNISSIEETAERSVKGATLTLSGVSSEALSLSLTEPYQGRVCNIYFGIEPDTTFNQIFSGYMDQMNITDAPDTCDIELKVENRLIDLERARVARFTSAYQKSVYSGDRGFDFVESLQQKPVIWGKR